MYWVGSQATILFFFSFFIVGSITPSIRKLAFRLNVVDHPNEQHKTHNFPIPYMGGVSIIMGVSVTTFAAIFISGYIELLFLASTVILPAIVMGIIGLIDDVKKLSPWPRFLAQNSIGLGIALALVSTDTLGAPTSNRLLDVIVSVIWIVGITNAVNFFDNIDGGASGTIAISSMFLCILSAQGGQYFIAALSVVLSGSSAGFLLWNKAPARIYMGDAGALFLGVLIASLTLRFNPSPIDRLASFAIPVLLLAVPILDTTVAVASRLKRGISPFQGGQDHLSHRLMNKSFSKRRAVITLWLITLLFALLATLISNAPMEFEVLFTIFAAIIWLTFLIFFLRMPLFNDKK